MATARACRGPIRPPLKYHGGKYPIASWIASLMPEHDAYVEPFLGGGSVYLAKPASECVRSYLFDVDPKVVRVWRTLEFDGRAVRSLLGLMPYGRASFDAAGALVDDEDGVVATIAAIIRSRWSRGGDARSFGRSSRRRGGQDEYVNSWKTFRDVDLPLICERLQRRDTCINCRSFREVLVSDYTDMAGALFYLDPPYHPSTRTTTDSYAHEMSHEDHVDLIDLATAAKAKVMLSGYRCPLYDERLSGWNRADREVPNHSCQRRTKSRRVESVWMNY